MCDFVGAAELILNLIQFLGSKDGEANRKKPFTHDRIISILHGPKRKISRVEVPIYVNKNFFFSLQKIKEGLTL